MSSSRQSNSANDCRGDRGGWIAAWCDPDEADPAKADGQIPYLVIGTNQVAVPTHLFKIVLSKNPQSGDWEALAFVLPNQKSFPSRPPLEDYLTTIDWIEQQAGYDFFSKLDDVIEKTLESQKATGLWAIEDACTTTASP